jgi:DNA primase
LEHRGFDPDWIALEHGVKAAGPKCLWEGEGATSDWKGSWFSNRLIVPIRDKSGQVVNFQGRSILKDEMVRWKGPPVDRVPVHQKTLLYGHHACTGDTVAVVEGICDQWRLGRGSVATFGTSLTVQQLRLLGGFRRVLFLFDSEPEAQARARRYAADLAALGRSVSVVDLELSGKRDMADLSEEEARAVRRELGI